MKTGLVKVQQTADRKMAKAIVGHVAHTRVSTYSLQSCESSNSQGHWPVYDQWTLWNISMASPTTLRFNFLMFRWHWCTDASYPSVCYSCKEHLLSDTLLCTFYHVMLMMYAAMVLRFDWLKSWLCNEFSCNKLLSQWVVSKWDVAQRVVTAKNSRCNELSGNVLSATRCRATSYRMPQHVGLNSVKKVLLYEVHLYTEMGGYACTYLGTH